MVERGRGRGKRKERGRSEARVERELGGRDEAECGKERRER